ncbi:MAG TPA: M1 family metallopeptidase [Saprospiraceae bacterium]|nr:M1 family metallopeptidase [Saprospiraceae bacterium]MBX7180208.1 M1 family metallopeptidase [Saprospiraceae bacterium]MCB0591552.1 M1 family metallopeptidase [Saprospiraceae bacterium]MCO5282596.1 M1 family metallopeptidase [Saprospiraceae bacterium]MCO6469578.1 M1 family metallopeptidase [Saprospiraceae bacterium]
MRFLISFWFFILLATIADAQVIRNNPNSNHANKFEQLGTILPTPNEYRSASGSPGPKYWQQRADYNIKCTLDEGKQHLTGTEVITYYNESPDPLPYLWMQLDENQHSNINNAGYQSESEMPRQLTDRDLRNYEANKKDNGFGFNITRVVDAMGKPISFTINKTMMRLNLSKPLKPGEKIVFTIDWNYNLVNRREQGGRGGYEYFPNDDNYLFTMTQWYPRMCVYSDFQGWQNHQFSGRAEFALTFGDFHVEMTVPSDHVVCATGECQNYDKVLTPAQLERWKKAQTASDVMEIVTLDEAKAAEKKKSRTSKTYIFEAKNVRDFAWGSSRKFVWDALPVDIEGKKVMAMSFYGKEAYGLYRPFSTKVVAHTIRTYSHFTIPYPYPVAQSVEASNGMEYPMICFNYGRTEEDGTYSEGIKNGMIGVIIHEVGHNFFPMIINSDERQWTWMDEGLNTFVEYLTEELWDNKFPSKRGPASSIVNYMKLPKDELEPIMTNSDNIVSFGPNAYAKPATGLNILRETIMGRELFDHAFRNYCRKWAFKHPTPADFFRSMEDASGEDLDWFWRGWFYSTDACDISLDTVKYAVADVNATVKTSRPMKRSVQGPLLNDFDDISKVRNREDKNIVFETDRDTTLRDFYWKYARNLETQDTTKFNVLWPESVEPLDESLKKQFEKFHAYELTLSNKGGLVMPVIIEWTYTDGSKEVERISAQIWRKNENKITKSFIKEKEVASILIDPFKETADIDESNNGWNVIPQPSKFKAFKQRKTMEKGEGTDINPMNVKKRT